LGTKVTEILLENQQAVGVGTEDGERYYAEAVVSNAAAPETFGKLLPAAALPADYRRKLVSSEPSLSTLVVWLGLDQDITAEIPWESCSVYDTYNQDDAYEAALSNDLNRSGFGATVYNKVADGFSPAGYSSVTLITMSGYHPWKRFEADYFAGNKEAYYAEKQRVTEHLISRAEERLLPGLSRMIVMQDAGTPLTNIRYTLNTAGAIVGYNQTLENAGPFRVKNRTPIKGLYLAGAWTFPGGGYEAVLLSGKYTFRNIITDWMRERPLLR
jgi:prolycopene isomerase